MPITKNPKAKPHLWILITEPNPNGECVVVNITSAKSTSVDRTVVLQKGDHPFIQHESVVFYAFAHKENVKKLCAYLASGTAKQKQALSNTMLKKIQNGILKSPDTPHEIVDFCKDLWKL
jgi:hypothetical protein